MEASAYPRDANGLIIKSPPPVAQPRTLSRADLQVKSPAKAPPKGLEPMSRDIFVDPNGHEWTENDFHLYSVPGWIVYQNDRAVSVQHKITNTGRKVTE